MENIIPINGRIAIVDDKPKEAMPLIRTFSHNNIPYVYIKGDDMNYLPQQPENDIRILFFDLNLIGGQAVSYKQVKSILIKTFTKLIAPNNYPYVLILWSKQEKEYEEIIKTAFDNELKDRKPIAIKSLPKTVYFPDFDEEEHSNNFDLFDELKKIVQAIPAYSYLMQWENIVHDSSDELLKGIFPNAEPQEWENVTTNIINSLGQAYLGKHFSDVSFEDRIKASLFVLNMVYIDSIDNRVNQCSISDPQKLNLQAIDEQKSEAFKATLNNKLLIYTNPNNICEPGVVFQYSNPTKDYFEQFLHKVLSIISIRREIISKKPDLLDSLLKKELNLRINQIKQEIQKTWMKIGVVVTSSCDYAQKKKTFDRIVQGVIIESRFVDYINQGDAFYTSPVIRYENRNYIVVLNFNYFITTELTNQPSHITLFKMRRQMLAEIQSKLARHISRQGIMNL